MRSCLSLGFLVFSACAASGPAQSIRHEFERHAAFDTNGLQSHWLVLSNQSPHPKKVTVIRIKKLRFEEIEPGVFSARLEGLPQFAHQCPIDGLLVEIDPGERLRTEFLVDPKSEKTVLAEFSIVTHRDNERCGGLEERRIRFRRDDLTQH